MNKEAPKLLRHFRIESEKYKLMIKILIIFSKDILRNIYNFIIFNYMSFLYSRGNLQESLRYGNKLDAYLRKQLCNKEKSQYKMNFLACVLLNKAAIHSLLLEWECAKLAYIEAENITRYLISISNKNWKETLRAGGLASVLTDRGFTHYKLQEHNKAQQCYTEAECIFRALQEEPGTPWVNCFARLLNRQGILYDTIGEYESAKSAYKESLELYRKQRASFMKTPVMGDFAGVLMNYGNLLSTLNQWEEAIANYTESEILFRKLGTESVDSELINEFAILLMNIGQLYCKLLELTRAEKAFSEADSLYRKICTNNANPYQIKCFCLFLLNKGSLFQQLNNYYEAQKAYDEAESLLHCHSNEKTFASWINEFILILMARGELHLQLKNLKLAQENFSKAEQFFVDAYTHDISSSCEIQRISILLSIGRLYHELGVLNHDLNKMKAAEVELIKAEKLCRQFNVEDGCSEWTEHLGMILLHYGNLQIDLQNFKGSLAAYSEAELLYRKLFEIRAITEHSVVLVGILMGVSVAHMQLRDFCAAEKKSAEAEILLTQLIPENTYSPLLNYLSNIMINRGILFAQLEQWNDVEKVCVKTLELYEHFPIYHYEFIYDLQKISRAVLQLPTANVFIFFSYINRLVTNFREQIFFDSEPLPESLLQLYKLWIEFALVTNNSRELANVLSASYARRMQDLLHLNLLDVHNLDGEVAEFVFLKKRLGQLELELETLEKYRVDGLYSQQQIRYQQQLNTFNALRDKWYDTYQRLIASGKYPDMNHAVFGVDDLQARMAQGQAVLLSLSFGEYGLKETPRLLLILPNELIDLSAPEQQAAAETVRLINRLLHGRDRHLPLRRNETQAEPVEAHVLDKETVAKLLAALESSLSLDVEEKWRVVCKLRLNELSAEQISALHEVFAEEKSSFQQISEDGHQQDVEALTQLRQQEWLQTVWPIYQNPLLALEPFMTACWQKLQPHLTEVRELAIVGHGELNGLPWQAYAPQAVQVRQYPGPHALQGRAATPPYPGAGSPLAILAHAAADQPDKHLHHLAAEVELIARVWGKARTVRIDRLRDAPANSVLLLLGHGDHDHGRARFLTAHGDLEQHELLLHGNALAALGASACMLAASEDVNAEPLGLMSFASCRGDVQFCYGALTPVDDFLCTCLSLLFHLAWRDGRDPAPAMRSALAQLAGGDWPEAAKALFREVFTEQLPSIFAAMEQDRRVAPEYVANSRDCWLRDNACDEHYQTVMHDADPKRQAVALAALIDAMLQALCEGREGFFKDRLEHFLPFWVWG